MVSQAELKKRRVKAAKEQVRQEQVVEVGNRRRQRGIRIGIAVLAFALIAPLMAGLVAFFDGDDDLSATSTAETPELELDSTPPSLVDPGFEGATLTGATPCPATDGSQERVTSFETAPSGCIDPAAGYTVALDTLAGEATVELDPTIAPEAADLFVSMARYGVYTGAPITSFEGLTVIGGFGDAGFTVPAPEPPADGQYPIGSVALLTELGSGLMTGQLVVVTNEAGAEELARDGATSPIIGSVTDGIDVFDGIAELAVENTGVTYRLRSADVTETAG